MAAGVPLGTGFRKDGDVWHSRFSRSALYVQKIPRVGSVMRQIFNMPLEDRAAIEHFINIYFHANLNQFA
jgi:hypothetical protein